MTRVASGWIEGFDAADVAAADAAALGTGADLMARAAHALAGVCIEQLRDHGAVSGARVVLLVGAGNNGGDALLAGALLRRRGVGVTAILCADRHHETGLRSLRRVGGAAFRLQDGDDGSEPPQRVRDALAAADLVVDGVLGIGARREVRGPTVQVFEALERRRTRSGVVACDLPSGLDPDTGKAHGRVLPADVTVTFGAAKTGLLLPAAQSLVGRLVVVDLGLRRHLPRHPRLTRLIAQDRSQPAAQVGEAWPWPWREGDKYKRGVLGVVAGEATYPGAAVLSCLAAVAAGASFIRFVPPGGAPDVGGHVLTAVPEAVVQPLSEVGRVQAWVLGPGTNGATDPRIDHVLKGTDEPAVVDAGGLRGFTRGHLAGTLRRPELLLLTPHAGELDRLLDDLGLDPVPPGHGWQGARAVAAATGATVLLKGPDTLVVSEDGTTVVVAGGPPELATAGAGDVLAGIAGTLLAGGLAPAEAGVLAAHVHATAAHRALSGGPLRALVVAEAVRGVLASARAESLASASADAWDHG